MKQTLFDLWNGNVHPWLEPSLHQKETKELSGYISDHINDLKSMLNAKGNENLQKLSDNYAELLGLECEAAFCKGFSLATKILLEAIK